MRIDVKFYIDLRPKENIYIKIKKDKTNYKTLLCIGFALALVINLPMLYAYEAHVINVTAEICNYSETRTMGYWKNHPEHFLSCGISTINLGNDNFDLNDPEDIQDLLYIFENAKAQDMINMLKGQLLAMKFNVACFGIGEYFYEPEAKTINEIIEEADALIIAHMPGDEEDREAMEQVKDILDYLNNIHTLRYCREKPEGFEPMLNNFISPIRLERILESLNSEPETPEGVIETQTSSGEETFDNTLESVIETETESNQETFEQENSNKDKDKENKGKKNEPPEQEPELYLESIIQVETQSNEE